MKAVVLHDVGDVRLDDVPEPSLQDPADAIIRLTASAICGWIKVELHPQKRPAPGSKGGEEVIEGEERLDRVIAEASPCHEARSAKPGRR